MHWTDRLASATSIASAGSLVAILPNRQQTIEQRNVRPTLNLSSKEQSNI